MLGPSFSLRKETMPTLGVVADAEILLPHLQRPDDGGTGERVARAAALLMLLLTLFAILALGLAAIGTYGVIAYLVSQGRRELGIRMALGATPAGILLMIVRHGAILAGCGIALGLVGAFALTPLMRSLLFGVGPADPVTYTGIALLLALVALTATLVPASRAARIDEGHVLRPTCKVLTWRAHVHACSRAFRATCPRAVPHAHRARRTWGARARRTSHEKHVSTFARKHEKHVSTFAHEHDAREHVARGT